MVVEPLGGGSVVELLGAMVESDNFQKNEVKFTDFFDGSLLSSSD
jgi:hypothetical protein